MQNRSHRSMKHQQYYYSKNEHDQQREDSGEHICIVSEGHLLLQLVHINIW